jgi:hypothetical protein
MLLEISANNRARLVDPSNDYEEELRHLDGESTKLDGRITISDTNYNRTCGRD